MKTTVAAALSAALLALLTLPALPANAAGKCTLWSAQGYPMTRTLMPTGTSMVLPADRYNPQDDGFLFNNPSILKTVSVYPRDDSTFPTFNNISTNKPYLFCDSSMGNWTTETRLEGLGSPIAGTNPPIYDSGVPGVGIRARMGLGNYAPFTMHYPSTPGYMGGHNVFNWTVEQFSIELIAIKVMPHQGTSTALGWTKPAMLTYTVKQGGGGPDLRVLTLHIPPVQFTLGTCAVDIPTVRMPPNVGPSAFLLQDAPLAASKEFPINLSCNAKVKVTYQITGNHVINAQKGILGLDPTPVNARNVGLQIQDPNRQPILFAPWWRPGAGDPEIITEIGPNVITLIAQYLRLKSGPVLPGLANATATVTMQYK